MAGRKKKKSSVIAVVICSLDEWTMLETFSGMQELGDVDLNEESTLQYLGAFHLFP